MKYKIEHIALKTLSALLLITIGSMLTACSSDSTYEDSEPAEESMNGLQVVSFTRSGGFGDPVVDGYSPLRLYLYSLEDGSQTELFYHNSVDNIWKSKLEVTAGRNYAIYGCAPATACTAELQTPTLTGATLKLSNVKAVTADDVCVVIGVQQLEAPTDAPNIKQGVFNYTGKAKTEANVNNYVHLLMDHVMAALQMDIKINATYATLRSIKLKKMELSTTKGTVDITIPLTANDTEANPIGAVTYTNLGGTSSSAIFFESETGVELKTTESNDALTATCCFAPTTDVSNNLKLTTTYDVYDRKGNFIGERTATNKLPNLTAATWGQRVKLTMTVNPTYLYMLSDPDLDNPTLTID